MAVVDVEVVFVVDLERSRLALLLLFFVFRILFAKVIVFQILCLFIYRPRIDEVGRQDKSLEIYIDLKHT